MSFLIDLKDGTASHEAHKNLLRFGTGTFTREKITLVAGANVTIAAGFEYLKFTQDTLLAHVESITYAGIVFTAHKKPVQTIMARYGIEPEKAWGKKITISGTMEASAFKTFLDELLPYGSFLGKITSDAYSVVSKSALPKPGKIVENFVKAKLPKNAKKEVQDAFIAPFEKRAIIETTYAIHEIVYDEALVKKDPKRARDESQRKLTIHRTLTIDGAQKEESFEACA